MTSSKTNNLAVQKKNPSFFWALLVILFLLAALSIYKPHTKSYYSIFYRTWGFDHISLYSMYGRVAFFALCFVIILPYTNNLIRLGFTWITDRLAGFGKKKIILFLVLSVLSSFLFYLLNVKYYFLGDFNLRMVQTMKKEFLATEYLTMRSLYAFAHFGEKHGYTHDQLFKLYSYIAGGFFVFISFLIADLTGKTAFQKVFIFLAQVSSAVVLVFCGYVEIYATPILLLSLYYYFGLRYLKLNRGFIFALLSLVLAIASHLLCLAAAPSLLVAWYFNNKDKVAFISRLSNKKIAVFLSVLIFLTLVVSIKAKSGFLLTLSPPPSKPDLLTLFNFRHFWELLNGQLLSCGLSFLFIFMLLFKSIKEKKQLFSEHYFLLSISGCFMLLVFMANLQRGSGDWDIMAFPAVSLNLLTVLLFAHLYKNQQNVARYLMIAIIGLNGLNTFLWLQVNHTDRSIFKIKKMLVNDPGTYYTARISGIIQLCIIYTNNKLTAEAERTALLACNIASPDDVRACVMYALALKNTKKLEEARIFFEDLLHNRTPFIYEAYLSLLEYYEKKNDTVKFYYYLNMFFDSFCQKPDPFMSNMNFKPSVLIKLFELIYQDDLKKNEIKQALRVKSVINSLRDLKPAEQKK